MRGDTDFMVYVAARWPSLVKEAVLLGVPAEEAAAATTDALSRCRRDWGRASREENVDALVQAELLLAARRRPRTEEADRERAAQELLVLAPPTLEDLTRQERVNLGATLRRAAWIGVPLLLGVVGLGVYLGLGDDDEKSELDDGVLENAAISLEANPAPDVVWYADGRLHLEHTVLAVEGLTDMTRIGNGVVYGDEEGRVVYAADDGSREVLGHKDAEVRVAATDETGWAAWVETEGDKPAIVVKEASTGNEVTRFAVDPGTQVIAVDGERIYYADALGIHARVPADLERTSLGGEAPLLDVRSRNQVFQDDPSTIRVLQSTFNAIFHMPGQGAALSPDGNLVATRLPDSDTVAVYDTRSGEALPNGVPDGDRVVSYAPGSRGIVTYVVAPAAQSPGQELELRTCEITTIAQCTVAARIPDRGGTPVLAR